MNEKRIWEGTDVAQSRYCPSIYLGGLNKTATIQFTFPINRNFGNVYKHKDKSRDSEVGIVMGYGLDGRVSIPDRGKVFLFSIAFMSALGPTQSPSQ
jgi:hypothetical protein